MKEYDHRMTEVQRAREALREEIKAYDEKEALLKSELAEAVQARDRCRSLLSSHHEERKCMLAPFRADVAAAERADV